MRKTAYISVDDEEVLGKLEAITRKANAIMANAANSALDDMRKESAESVVARYHVKKKDVRATFVTSRKLRATKAMPTAIFMSRQERRPDLFKFKVSPRDPVKRTKVKKKPTPKVYKASIVKTGGLKPLDYPRKPFVAVIKKNGHTGMFFRTDEPSISNPKRKKIRTVFGPDIPMLVGGRYVRPDLEREAQEQMKKQILDGIEKA